MTLTKAVMNCSTGELSIIELTPEEIAEAEAMNAAAEADLSMIRSQRDYHLQVCDWTQVSDSPLTDEKKAEWVTYRRELRDFPAGKTKQADFARDEDGVMIWPTPPS